MSTEGECSDVSAGVCSSRVFTAGEVRTGQAVRDLFCDLFVEHHWKFVCYISWTQFFCKIFEIYQMEF